MNLMNRKKVGPNARTCRCRRFARVIRLIRFRGTCIGGECLSLQAWGHFRCSRFMRFGPWSASTESNASKVPPRTSVSGSTRALPGPLKRMHRMQLMTLSRHQGQDFRFIKCIRFGPWPESNGIECIENPTQGQDFSID